MNFPGLIGVGRLGGLDAEGFHHVMIKPDYRSVFNQCADVYLIFNSDRVFYVSIIDRKQSDKKLWVKFAEDGIAAEQKLHKEVILAIADDEMAEEDDLDDLLGYKVLFNGEDLGEVDDYFFNGAQHVLQVVDPKGAELLIPFVDHYVKAVEDKSKTIVLQNAEELIALYRGDDS